MPLAVVDLVPLTRPSCFAARAAMACLSGGQLMALIGT